MSPAPAATGLQSERSIAPFLGNLVYSRVRIFRISYLIIWHTFFVIRETNFLHL